MVMVRGACIKKQSQGGIDGVQQLRAGVSNNSASEMPYGDAAFDLFVAQIGSPEFQSLCAAAFEVSSANEAAAGSAADSPVRITWHKPKRPRCSRRVIMGSSDSSSSFSFEGNRDEASGIFGGKEGDLLCSKDIVDCNSASHTKCLARVLRFIDLFVPLHVDAIQVQAQSPSQVAVLIVQECEEGASLAGNTGKHVRLGC